MMRKSPVIVYHFDADRLLNFREMLTPVDLGERRCFKRKMTKLYLSHGHLRDS